MSKARCASSAREQPPVAAANAAASAAEAGRPRDPGDGPHFDRRSVPPAAGDRLAEVRVPGERLRLGVEPRRPVGRGPHDRLGRQVDREQQLRRAVNDGVLAEDDALARRHPRHRERTGRDRS